MLLDFTVANYRSIKEPVTLSAVAQKQRRVQSSENGERERVKSDGEIAPPYFVSSWDIEVLPVLAIFGANASGKTNVIQALVYLLSLMKNGKRDNTIQEDGLTPDLFGKVSPLPFLLDDSYAGQATKFELRTIFDETIYSYSLTTNSTRILVENLDYFPKSSRQKNRLFERVWNHDEGKFLWKNGRRFSGAHIQLQKSIREDESFISLLGKLEVEIVKPLIDWIKNQILGVSASYSHSDYTLSKIILSELFTTGNHLEFYQSLSNFIQLFDVGITDIEIKNNTDLKLGCEIYTLHTASNGETMKWLLIEESLGTQKLLYFATRMIFNLAMGSLTIVDEFGSSFHPHISHAIIKLFQNPETNPKHAQLIFTSHDNTLQRNNLLRKDQIWFTQKRPDHSTELYPLTDFKVRNDLALDKAYLDGRFGAVPILPSEDELLSGVKDL
jgi:uncharacterized protein